MNLFMQRSSTPKKYFIGVEDSSLSNEKQQGQIVRTSLYLAQGKAGECMSGVYCISRIKG